MIILLLQQVKPQTKQPALTNISIVLGHISACYRETNEDASSYHP